MIKNLLLLTLTIVTFISCKRKEATTWDVNINAPIVTSSLSILDIFETNVTENPDSSLVLVYNYNLNTINTDSLFTVPDTIMKGFYNLPFLNPVNLNPGFQFANDPAVNTFNYGGARIREMKVISGKIKYKITSQINEKTIYKYKILKSSDALGDPFEKNIIVPAGTVSNPSYVNGEFDIDGYTLDMTGQSGNIFNTLETEVEVIIDPNGNPVLVSKTDSVFVENSLIDIKPEYIKGYLGQDDFSEGPTNVDFDIFNSITDGTIDLDDVNIKLQIRNYMGIDAQLKISLLDALNTRTSNSVSLTHNVINNWVNINRASEINGNITPTLTTKVFDNNNSNIDAFIENLPNKLQYAFEAKLNPLGNVSNGNDFLFTKNTIDIDFDINIPLNVIANNLTLIDTIDFNVNPESNPINSTLFSLVANNGFPFDANVQLYILDQTNTICDSIFDNTAILSGLTNVGNIVTQSTSTKLESVVSEDKMEKVNANSKMIIKVIYNTNSVTHSQIYSHYKIDLTLIADMDYSVSIK